MVGEDIIALEKEVKKAQIRENNKADACCIAILSKIDFIVGGCYFKCPTCGKELSMLEANKYTIDGKEEARKLEAFQRQKQEEQPSIQFSGKTYYQVGCRGCGRGDHLKFYSDREKFILQCACGHIINIKQENLTNKPDPQPIPLRMVI